MAATSICFWLLFPNKFSYFGIFRTSCWLTNWGQINKCSWLSSVFAFAGHFVFIICWNVQHSTSQNKDEFSQLIVYFFVLKVILQFKLFIFNVGNFIECLLFFIQIWELFLMYRIIYQSFKLMSWWHLNLFFS